MIGTLALALALQAPNNVPRDAEVIYALMPEVSPLAGNVNLVQSIHSVTTTLSKDSASYETLSLYKNSTNNSGTVKVVVPFESWRYGFGDGINVTALWDDKSVRPTQIGTVLAPVPEKGQVGRYAATFSLPVAAKGTHSLKLRYMLPVGVSGVDREERLVAYRVANLAQTASLDQFRMSVKFS